MNDVNKKAPYVVEWRDGFKVHIAQIDREHKHLFSLVRALNLESVDQTIEALLEYVVTHFTNEQALMERSGYPSFEHHLQLHEAFAAQVADFLDSTEPWSEERVHDLRRFLNKWLIGHIMTHDLRFGNWYRDHLAAQARQAAVLAPTPAPARGLLARLFGWK